MRRRDVELTVSDHAVLRYLERAHGLDVAAVRQHLHGLALGAAALGAVAVRIEGVRLFLREADARREGGGIRRPRDRRHARHAPRPRRCTESRR